MLILRWMSRQKKKNPRYKKTGNLKCSWVNYDLDWIELCVPGSFECHIFAEFMKISYFLITGLFLQIVNCYF